jgi:hypothetical protein
MHNYKKYLIAVGLFILVIIGGAVPAEAKKKYKEYELIPLVQYTKRTNYGKALVTLSDLYVRNNCTRSSCGEYVAVNQYDVAKFFVLKVSNKYYKVWTNGGYVGPMSNL